MTPTTLGDTLFSSWRTWPLVLVGAVLLFAVAGAVKPWGDEASQVRVAPSTDDSGDGPASPPTTRGERLSGPVMGMTAPDGGSRSSASDVDAGNREQDTLDRAAPTTDDAELLASLPVRPEVTSPAYDRALFPHWDDADNDGCDTRCEVLTAQRSADGSWFSEWDGTTETDPALVHIDHVVALAEAWRSGAHAWSDAQRDRFADDRSNLIAVTEASNIRKSDHDASSWFPSRSEANCLWARTVVHVKSTWKLSVDEAERTALENLLATCGAVLPPPTTTTTTTTTTAPPPPPPTVAPPPLVVPPPSNDCTPGYSPCLPPASDYDCSGGSGNGPAYTGRVSVDPSGGDPYDLDRDGDGIGCE